jgi:cytoskeletal protein CcmA (bactofilin family)
MWNKSTPGQPSQEEQSATASPDNSSHTTVFGKSMKIVGEVSSDEDLHVYGDLEGKLVLKNRLTIGPDSKVKANIKAKEVTVFGTVHGNVEAEQRMTLRTGATIVGDIKTAGIVIEDGAYFKGGIDISRPEPAKPAQKAAAAGDKR